jgi:transposase InsO family protein
MGDLGLRGVVRGNARPRTTLPEPATDRPADRMARQFRAAGPDRPWVADLTSVKTHRGWVDVARIVDGFSRFVVGRQPSRPPRTDPALDAPEMALRARRAGRLPGLIRHSDRAVPYLAVRSSERLAEAGVVASVGSRDDSYDDALAASFHGRSKAELIATGGRTRGRPTWRSPRRRTSTGSTAAGATRSSAWFRRPSSSPALMGAPRPSRRRLPDSPSRYGRRGDSGCASWRHRPAVVRQLSPVAVNPAEATRIRLHLDGF